MGHFTLVMASGRKVELGNSSSLLRSDERHNYTSTDSPHGFSTFAALLVFDVILCALQYHRNSQNVSFDRNKSNGRPVWYHRTMMFLTKIDSMAVCGILVCFLVETLVLDGPQSCTMLVETYPTHLRWISDVIWMTLFACIRKMALHAPSQTLSDCETCKHELKLLGPVYLLVLLTTLVALFNKHHQVLFCEGASYRPFQIIAVAMFFIRVNPIWVIVKSFKNFSLFTGNTYQTRSFSLLGKRISFPIVTQRKYNQEKADASDLIIDVECKSKIEIHVDEPIVNLENNELMIDGDLLIDVSSVGQLNEKAMEEEMRVKSETQLDIIPGKDQLSYTWDLMPENGDELMDFRILALMLTMSVMFTVICIYVNSYLLNIYKIVFPSVVLSICWNVVGWITKSDIV